jgi:phosphoadenosine phosphosulfate reductase
MSDIQLIEGAETLGAEELLGAILAKSPSARACLTCSFQAEDMIVLSLLRRRLPEIPVLFLETGYHFTDTYRFRDQMAADWKLNLVNVAPQTSVEQQESQFGLLYQLEPTKCCQLRKVQPLIESLEPFELWFTGLRREQSPTRRNLKKIEDHKLPTGKTLLKINLLADWTWAQVWKFTEEQNLAHLPQYDRGFLSIGCEPCTAIPASGADARSGRWGGKKLECGIHTFSEKTGG